MNYITISKKVETMSSKRIAELTGKTHAHVLRDIRNMIDEIQNPNMDSSDYQVVTSERNGMTEEVLLSEELSLTLAAGYSTQLRNVIIKDWLRLKSQENRELSRKDLALMVLQAEEEKERLLLENAELKPKAEYTDKVLTSADSFTTTTIAKEIGMSAIELNKELVKKGIQFSIDNHYVLYQKYANKGYTATRTHQYTDNNGKSHTRHNLVWTEAGRMFIHSLF